MHGRGGGKSEKKEWKIPTTLHGMKQPREGRTQGACVAKSFISGGRITAPLQKPQQEKVGLNKTGRHAEEEQRESSRRVPLLENMMGEGKDLAMRP